MAQVKYNYFGIKTNFKIPFIKQCRLSGEVKENGNIVEVDDCIAGKVKVKGKNNVVKITGLENGRSKKVRINIKGNNNRIEIKNLRMADLYIDIGNYTGVDNVHIEIDERFVCVKVDILAYSNNTPIKIGKNCLFSKNVIVRSGELPHAVFDMNTFENFDKSSGIVIGEHVWVGENSYILKNAQVADNSIVGAMSVVTKRFNQENVVIAGNPAKICKTGVMWDENYLNVKYKEE